jgi:CubicO group peptidase (beta-lactamase class C family)
MYGLISRITEVIGGKSWEDLMVEKIFHPLGMTDSNFTHTMDLEADDVAHAYLWDGEQWREVSMFLHR